MGLRKQLLLVSLLLLLLPLAVLQYARQMESALVNVQTSALSASAQTIAVRLSAEPELQQYWASLIDNPEQLYVHPLPWRPELDGYQDDWDDLGLAPSASNPDYQLYLGSYGSSIYMLLGITTQEGQQDNQPLILDMGDNTEYIIDSGRNKLSAKVWKKRDNQDKQPEYRIRAVWQQDLLSDIKRQYFEIQLPANLLQQSLSVNQQVVTAPNIRLGTHRIIKPRPELQQAIALFASDNTRVSIVNPQGFLLAQTNRIPVTSLPIVDNLQQRLWRQLIAAPTLRNEPHHQLKGQMQWPFQQAALMAQADANAVWVKDAGQTLVRVTSPLTLANMSIESDNNNHSQANKKAATFAYIVVEQPAGKWMHQNQKALWQLLGMSFMIILLASAGLLAYAGWLSLRVRRLHRLAETALDEQGNVTTGQLHSNASDEIGDLHRAYADLLNRLQEYTDYLRSLAGKLQHELRTPLAIVRSSLDNLDAANQQSDSQAIALYSQRAQQGCTRLSGILTAMGAASRIEQAVNNVEKEPVNLTELLQNLVKVYADTYTSKQQHFQYRNAITGNTEQRSNMAMANINPDLIVQAIDKLIENAVDHCPKDGYIQLRLAAKEEHWVISVRNSGSLLPKHMQYQLFDSLVSIREQNKNQQLHLGLGLYIVRLIAEAHQGRAQATNLKNGKGVSFDIFIPM